MYTGMHPAKPRMMLYSRSISDEEEEQDAEWKLISHAEVAGKNHCFLFLCYAYIYWFLYVTLIV